MVPQGTSDGASQVRLPEPSTWTLLGLAIGGTVVMALRRKAVSGDGRPENARILRSHNRGVCMNYFFFERKAGGPGDGHRRWPVWLLSSL